MKFLHSMNRGFNSLALLICLSFLLPGNLISKAKDTGGHPFLGVSVRDMNHAEKKENRISHGVMVVRVEGDSSAANAGMKKGDIIQKLDAVEIFSPGDLVKAVRSLKVGAKVNVRITRNKKSRTLNAVLGSAPEQSRLLPRKFSLFKGEPRPWIGAVLHDMNEDLAAYFGNRKKTGVLILSLDKEGPGARGGMKSGDVIHEVDGERVRSASDIRRIVKELSPGSEIELIITRHAKSMKVSVTLGKMPAQQGWRIFRNRHGEGDPEGEVNIFVTPEEDVHSKMREVKKKKEKISLKPYSHRFQWIEENKSRKKTIFI